MTSAAASAERQEPPMGWSGQEVIDATEGSGAAGGWFEAVVTDSRRLAPGCLFVALRGPNHDGHAFAAAALAAGAAGVLVDHVPPGVDPARALVVGDTLRALGDLAAYTRRRHPLRVAAVTGSNGKTTTKEMIAAVCEQARFPPPATRVLKTRGNENNLVGLPLTLFRLNGDEAVAVLEMGMNARGEIARLTEIAAPDVGVVTNVGAAHLEGLGSLEGVAAAKGELFAGMARETVAAVNMDDPHVVRIARRFPGRRIEFGRGRAVDARRVRENDDDTTTFELVVEGAAMEVRLGMTGRHNVRNAVAAAAVALGLGLEREAIRRGLEAARPPSMRMQVIRLANGVTLINDGYNANPTSMEAALLALVERPGRSIAVLGEMRELGAQGERLHRELGRRAVELGVDVLVAVGPCAELVAAGALGAKRARVEVHACADGTAAAERIGALWAAGDTVLLKGSRGADDEEAVRRYGARMAEVAARLGEVGGRP